jgi:hypothetical protein
MKGFFFLTASAAALSLIAALFHSGSSKITSSNQALNGAFRDGLYLGTLTAKHGEEPHIAAGRWARSEDRQSFAEGYLSGYNGTLARILRNTPKHHNNRAEYRNGLYLGTHDAEQHRIQHIATGPSSQSPNRDSYAAGCQQACSTTMSTYPERTEGTPQALPLQLEAL